MEVSRNRVELTREEQVADFTRLTDAVAFEEFHPKKIRRREKFFRWRDAKA